MRVKKFKLDNNISWFQNNIACLHSLTFLTYRKTLAHAEMSSSASKSDDSKWQDSICHQTNKLELKVLKFSAPGVMSFTHS